MFKDDLRDTVLKKNANRLGDYADNDFYIALSYHELNTEYRDGSFTFGCPFNLY